MQTTTVVDESFSNIKQILDSVQLTRAVRGSRHAKHTCRGQMSLMRNNHLLLDTNLSTFNATTSFLLQRMKGSNQ